MAYTRRHPRTAGTDTDDHGAFQGRSVDIGPELFAMSAAVVYAQTAMPEHPERAAETQELADAFCNQAQHRSGCSTSCGAPPTRPTTAWRWTSSAAGTWLEAGIVDPSAGDGPMVPWAETDRGDSGRRRRDDGRPPGRGSNSTHQQLFRGGQRDTRERQPGINENGQ